MAAKYSGYVEYSPFGSLKEEGVDALKDAMLELRQMDNQVTLTGLKPPQVDMAGSDVGDELVELAGAHTTTPKSIAHASADSRTRNVRLREEMDDEAAQKERDPDNSTIPQDTIDEKVRLYNEGRGFVDLADEKERAASRSIVGHGGPAALQNASRGIDSLLAGIARRKAIKAGAYDTSSLTNSLLDELFRIRNTPQSSKGKP